MNDNIILEVKNLHKTYEKQEVLKGITTTVKKGDVIAVIGPSGCGKSTFLRSLNLLEVPTKGQILFEGTDLTDTKYSKWNSDKMKNWVVVEPYNLYEEDLREYFYLSRESISEVSFVKNKFIIPS